MHSALLLRRSLATAIVLAIGLVVIAQPAFAQTLRTVALLGEVAPDTGGATYQSFGTPVLAENGHIAFRAMLTGGTSFVGLFVDTGSGPQKAVVSGDAYPDTPSAIFNGFGEPAINADGRIGFTGTSNQSGKGLFLWSGGTPTTVASVGDIAPDTGGLAYTSFGIRPVSINNDDEIAFQGVAGAPGTSVGGVWVESPIDPRAVVLNGQAAPAGVVGSYLSVSAPVINEDGDVAMPATLSIPGNTASIVKEIAGVESIVAKRFDPLPPPQVGVFNGFVIEYAPAINSIGEVVFDGSASSDGLYLQSGGVLEGVVLEGETAPDTGGGTFDEFLDDGPGLNASGEIVFAATVTAGTSSAGIFTTSTLGDAAIVLEGEVAPDAGGAVFSTFPDRPRINDSGVIAFGATLTGGTAAHGIFAVPEPGFTSLFGAGLVTLYAMSRSRRRTE